jgi:hypothetical protein
MAMEACELFILPCLLFFPVPDQDYTVFFAMRKPRDPLLPKADTTPLMNARSVLPPRGCFFSLTPGTSSEQVFIQQGP